MAAAGERLKNPEAFCHDQPWPGQIFLVRSTTFGFLYKDAINKAKENIMSDEEVRRLTCFSESGWNLRCFFSKFILN